MHLRLLYPVIVKGIPKGGVNRRALCGMASADYEVTEASAEEMTSVLEGDGRKPILAYGGRCYTEVDNPGWVEGATVDLIDFETGKTVTSFRQEFGFEVAFHLGGHGGRSFSPALDVGFFHGSRAQQAQIHEHFRKAGDLLEREAVAYSKTEMEVWKGRATRYMDSFLLCEGRLYQRCHEPILVATPGRVEDGLTSLFGVSADGHVNHRLGRVQRVVAAGEENFLAFPMDALDDAVEAAARLGNTAPAFVEGVGALRNRGCAVSSADRLSDLDVVRFAQMYAERTVTLRNAIERLFPGQVVGDFDALYACGFALSRAIGGPSKYAPVEILDMDAASSALRAARDAAALCDFGYLSGQEVDGWKLLVERTELVLDRHAQRRIDILDTAPQALSF